MALGRVLCVLDIGFFLLQGIQDDPRPGDGAGAIPGAGNGPDGQTPPFSLLKKRLEPIS